MSDFAAQARVRLWLRSEKAFGLGSLPRPAEGAVEEPEAVEQRPEPAPPKVTADAKVSRGNAEMLYPSAAPGVENLLMPDPQTAAFTAPLLSREEKVVRLKALDEKEVSVCTRCRLCETRTKTVFGEGDAGAKIFFIGEGPGENEDLSGRPFVGKAGQLLDKMIAGMGLKREQVYIANIVKCRPPNNRVPAPDEVATCTPYLVRQLEIIRPKVIVTLGLPSAKYMLNTKSTMGRLRGQWQEWRGIKLMPTFHPAYLLRSYTEENRAAVWSDLKAVMADVGLPIPDRAKGGR